jgi:cytochrome c
MKRLLAVAAMVLVSGQALALSPAAQRGLTFAEVTCAKCHAVGRFGPSPLPIAPPFRTFHDRFDIERLVQSLALGTVSDHPTMPHFSLDAAEIDDLMAYLRTLSKPSE